MARTTEQAFNEWMRRFIEEPDEYQGQVSQVKQFLSEGDEPTYGAWCAEYLARLMADD